MPASGRARAAALRLLSIAAIAVGLGGCAMYPLGQPVPGVDNMRQARSAGIAPIALGNFVPGAGLGAGLDEKVSIRTNTIFSPYGSSFAAYLRETAATDLRAAGLLDPAAAQILDAELTENRIDVPTGEASGRVAARFILRRRGVVVYAKEHRVEQSWEAPFVGVEAIPMAINRYGVLYRQLFGELLRDPAFGAAAR
jgi:hypothetical protein